MHKFFKLLTNEKHVLINELKTKKKETLNFDITQSITFLLNQLEGITLYFNQLEERLNQLIKWILKYFEESETYLTLINITISRLHQKN